MTYHQDFTSHQTKRKTASAKHPAPKHPALGKKLTKYTKYGIIKQHSLNNNRNKYLKTKKEARCLTVQQLQDATAKYETIKNRIKFITMTVNPVEMVTPIDLGEAKANWIENAKNGVFVNPIFHYDYTAIIREIQKIPMIENLRTDLAATSPDTEAEKFLYEHLMDVLYDTLHSLRAFEAIVKGNDKVSASHFLAKYGQSDSHMYWLAINLAEHGTTSKTQKTVKLSAEDTKLLLNAKLNAEFIRQMFIWAMEQYGEPWPVEIQTNCAAIDVRDKNSLGKPSIVIPADKRVSGFKLVELIGHEIECHWRGSINAERIGLLKADSEIIYEGVAKLKDYQFGADFLGEATMPKPYYIIAERQAMLGYSFAEVGQNLTNLLNGDAKRAWGFTYRTFRGITDTTNGASYAFTKDRAYLEGFILARAMAQNPNNGFTEFSTLNPVTFAKLSKLLDHSELETQFTKDRHIQEAALREILKRLKS